MSSTMVLESARGSGQLDSQRNPSLSATPTEILLEIIECLPTRHIVPLSATCKRLRQLCLPLQFRVLTLDFSVSDDFVPDRCCLYHTDELVRMTFPKPSFAKGELKKHTLPRNYSHGQQVVHSLKKYLVKGTKNKNAIVLPEGRKCALWGISCICLKKDFRWSLRSTCSSKWIMGSLHDALPRDITEYIETLDIKIPWGSNQVLLQLFVGHSLKILLGSLSRLKQIIISDVRLIKDSREPIIRLMSLVSSAAVPTLDISLNSQGGYRYEWLFFKMAGLKRLVVRWDDSRGRSVPYFKSNTEAALIGVMNRSPGLETLELISDLMYAYERISIDRIISRVEGDEPLSLVSLSIQNIDPPQSQRTIGRLKHLQEFVAGDRVHPTRWQEEWSSMWPAFGIGRLRLRSVTSAVRMGYDLFEYLTSYPFSPNQLQKLCLYVYHTFAEPMKDQADIFWRVVLPSISISLTELVVLPIAEGYANYRSRNCNPEMDEFMSKWSLAAFNDEEYLRRLSFPILRNVEFFSISSLDLKWYSAGFHFASRCPTIAKFGIEVYTDRLQSNTAFDEILNDAVDNLLSEHEQADTESILSHSDESLRVTLMICMMFVRRASDQHDNTVQSQDSNQAEHSSSKEETTGSIVKYYQGI